MQLEHLDAALLHLEHEVEVVLAGLLHPDDVVEQQVVGIAGSKPLVGQARPADHDGAKLADFRMDAELTLHGYVPYAD